MWKSTAEFRVAGQTLDQILDLTAWIAAKDGMFVESRSTNHVSAAAGTEILTGRQILVVTAFPAPEGTSVRVEAWLEAGWTHAVKPKRIFPNSPVNRLYRTAADIVSRLGADPNAVFVHRRDAKLYQPCPKWPNPVRR